MAEIGDHYQSGDTSVVYRVVGTTDGITLLRVTDADGRRAYTGDLRRVSEGELDAAFEPAEDPDAGVSPVGSLRNLLQGMYWEVRKLFP
jgi:hypothetical protein